MSVRKIFGFQMCMAFILFLFLLMPAYGAQPDTKTIELKFASISAPNHVLNAKVHTPWIRQIEAATNGQVKIQLFPGAVMGGAKQAYDLAETGIADISYGWVHYIPGRFPLTEAYNLPGVLPNLEAAYHIWDVYHKYLQKEWAGTKLLWIGYAPSMKLITKTKQIRMLDDVKGLKIAIQGIMAANIARSIGGIPVDVNAQDVYTSVQRGVTDGCFNPISSSAANKYGEVLKYYLMNMSIYAPPCFAVMNLDRYKALPSDIRKVIDEYSGQKQWEFVMKTYWDEEDTGQKLLMQQSGGKAVFYDIQPQELKKFQTLVRPMWDEWVKNMGAKGLPGKEMLDMIVGYINK
jgi:TRAP-type transport system periplasmic protein